MSPQPHDIPTTHEQYMDLRGRYSDLCEINRDLLAALKAIVEEFPGIAASPTDAAKLARTAIAKAEEGS